ncbi:hypothetical protein MRX96_029660 [Rhipicephalus microplus]
MKRGGELTSQSHERGDCGGLRNPNGSVTTWLGPLTSLAANVRDLMVPAAIRRRGRSPIRRRPRRVCSYTRTRKAWSPCVEKPRSARSTSSTWSGGSAFATACLRNARVNCQNG